MKATFEVPVIILINGRLEIESLREWLSDLGVKGVKVVELCGTSFDEKTVPYDGYAALVYPSLKRPTKQEIGKLFGKVAKKAGY